MVEVWMLFDKLLPRYRLLENFNTKILDFGDVLDLDPFQPHPYPTQPCPVLPYPYHHP